ncbi:MAG: D-aminoacyl-tRNA deacylase [Candidatus Micrarchaeia archaeon]
MHALHRVVPTIGIIFNEADEASKNIADYLRENAEFAEDLHGVLYSEELDAALVRSETELINAEFVDTLGLDAAYMLSKHVSAAGVGSFTTHATGNWNGEAKLGGKPHALSVAAPIEMLTVLQKASKAADKNTIEVTYEATHHGPLLNTPSLFVEIGGNENTIASKELAGMLGASLLDSLRKKAEYSKIVIGIGSNHYPRKFSELAKNKGYAFAHIMPKYALYNADDSSNIFMLEQAFKRSKPEPEIAVIDWHSFNANERQEIIKKLNEIGSDYERA